MTHIEKLLDKARWAPSGDNEQAWRVKMIAEDACEVTTGYLLDTIFHLNRHSDHIALGCFLENMHTAAGALGFDIVVDKVDPPQLGKAPVYRVVVSKSQNPKVDPLARFIEHRMVNRFTYAMTPLKDTEKKNIEAQMPSGYKILWFEDKQKMDFASLIFKSAALRYLIPEMFDVHSKIVDWEHDLSPDRIPSKALGMPTLFLPIMRWFLGKPQRMEAYNRLMLGHYMTALKLELLPNIMCSAGIAIVTDKTPTTPEDWIAAGRAIQRFWLALTSQGLSHQPSYTPMLFSKYLDEGKVLSTMPHVKEKAMDIKEDLSTLLGSDSIRKNLVWMGRVGFAKPKTSRSIRLSLNEIMVKDAVNKDNHMSLINISNVNKSYFLNKNRVDVLKGINLSVGRGEFLAIAGPSGSGKTTLLNIIGCIDTASSGQVIIDGQDVSKLSPDALADLRAHKISFIFQNFNLLPVLSAVENVEFPLLQKTMTPQERRRKALAALDAVGLSKHANHKPLELSGGQQQRVAIARAMVREPLFILADEPTANLDHKTGEEIIALMKKSSREKKITYIFSTHDQKVMDEADRLVRIWDGVITA